MIKHYVNFDTPGALLPETVTRQVRTRIPARLRNIPTGTYAITFWDREEQRHNKETLVGERKNHSKRILFGETYTPEQIKEIYGEDTLYRNIVRNGWSKGVYCIAGNWQPLQDGEIALSAHSDLRLMKGTV